MFRKVTAGDAMCKVAPENNCFLVTRCDAVFAAVTAQQSAVNRLVAGSNPARGAKLNQRLSSKSSQSKSPKIRPVAAFVAANDKFRPEDCGRWLRRFRTGSASRTSTSAGNRSATRAAGEPAKFSRSRVELLGVVSAARLECSEPAAETGELVRRQRLSCGAVWHGCLG